LDSCTSVPGKVFFATFATIAWSIVAWSIVAIGGKPSANRQRKTNIFAVEMG